jgi:hypothetical protein
MDDLAVSFHTTKTKKNQQSMQLAKKDPQAPEKPEFMRPETRMALIFFDTKGVIYSNYIHKGGTINAKYMKKALARFLVIFRPIMSSHETGILSLSTFHLRPAFLWQRKGIKQISTLPISRTSPQWTSSFPQGEARAAGLSVSQDSFQKSLEGVFWTIAQDYFATAFGSGQSDAKSTSGSVATLSRSNAK